MRDAGMCDARIEGNHTRPVESLSLSSPTRNFHRRSFQILYDSILAQKTHAKIRPDCFAVYVHLKADLHGTTLSHAINLRQVYDMNRFV